MFYVCHFAGVHTIQLGNWLKDLEEVIMTFSEEEEEEEEETEESISSNKNDDYDSNSSAIIQFFENRKESEVSWIACVVPR